MSTTYKRHREDGFTLIELLVVMIIIGILAAVAIPIFLNQQKTARDTATLTDAKNLITNVQGALVKTPDASYFKLSDTNTAPAAGGTTWASDTNGDGKLYLFVGASQSDNTVTQVSISKGTVLEVNGTNGTYGVSAYNPNGKVHNNNPSWLYYYSSTGKFATS